MVLIDLGCCQFLTFSLALLYPEKMAQPALEGSTKSKRFETMKLANGFIVVCDGGQELNAVGETVTMFGEAGVNAYMNSATSNQNATTDGRLIVDRGVLLLQRSYLSAMHPNELSIRLFYRGKMDDSVPDLVIPITYIKNELSGSILRSSTGSIVKTKIVVETTHSLNTVVTMEPMVITLKMSVVGASTLLSLVKKNRNEGSDTENKTQHSINAILKKLP